VRFSICDLLRMTAVSALGVWVIFGVHNSVVGKPTWRYLPLAAAVVFRTLLFLTLGMASLLMRRRDDER
jgi:hypothetical protein